VPRGDHVLYARLFARLFADKLDDLSDLAP
jgi:hypothetical protein